MYVKAVKLKAIFTRILLTIQIYIIIIIFNYKLLKKNRTLYWLHMKVSRVE